MDIAAWASPSLSLRDSLVDQRCGDRHLKLGRIAVPKSPRHLVVGGYRRLGVAELSLRDSLVDQRCGDRHLKLGRIAVPKSPRHLVVGGYRRLGVAELFLRDSLVEQRCGDRHLKFGRIAVPKSPRHLVVGRYRRLGVAEPSLRDSLVEQRCGCILVIHSRSSLGCQTNGLPFLVGEEMADVRRFRYRPLDSLTDGWRLHRLPSQPSGHPRQFIIGIKHRHEVDQVAHDGCLVAFATQLVVDAVQTLCGRVDALPAVSFHDDCAPLNDEPSEQGRYGSNV